MAFARPSTPSATPKRPATRAQSRASSRPASPSKPSTLASSLNQPLPRPASRTGIAGTSRPGSRLSTTSNGGPASPTKRLSVTGEVARSSGAGRSSTPTTPGGTRIRPNGSNNMLSATGSLLSIASARSTGGRGPGGQARPSVASTIASSVSYQTDLDDNLVTEDELDDVPRRRAGFGPPSTPRGSRPLLEDFESEDGRRSSIVERAYEEVSGTEGEETETEEEEKDGKQQNVVVCLRVRPPKSTNVFPAQPIYTFSPADSTLSLTSSHPTLLKRFGSSTSVLKAMSDEYEFRFDLLHVHPSPTEDLYDKKIRPVVKAALGGFNGTVFAYGQTASGKTHTMLGSPSEPGIIPLAIDELFSHIHSQHSRRSYSLRVSFLEIYNEQLRDLLASSTNGKGPEIVENGMVKNLEERAVGLPEEVLEVLKEGETRRRVGATDWNERSSRSHCVFIVTIESMSKKDGSARTSKLNLIDLAGSESATGQEERRKEGAFINKSLLTLGTVIGKLTDPTTSTAHIPYRDSKLTRLLQPALSGNSRVAVVCTVSPDAEQATETLSTLKFAKRAKMVVTKAERGVLVTDAVMLKRYAAQIAHLETQISSLESHTLASERDAAFARLTEAERLGREQQSALEEKEKELERLRNLLSETQRFVLTGPELERSARRVSGAHGMAELPMVLSPSRSRSVRGTGWTPSKRVISDVSGLGLGTPAAGAANGRGTLRASAGARLAEEDESREKEAALTQQLEAAQAQLASLSSANADLETLRAQLSDLEGASARARVDADASAQLSEDRRQRIVALEREISAMKEELDRLQAERDSLRTALQSVQDELQTLRKKKDQEVKQLQERVERMEQDHAGSDDAKAAALREAQDALRKRDALVGKLEASVAALERRLSAKDVEAQSLSAAKEETIASLSRQVDSVKTELATVIAAREGAVKAALDEAAATRLERDVALKSVEEAERRVKEVEELGELHTQQHKATEQQLEREKELALQAVQAEVERLKLDLQAKAQKADLLQRAVDRFERLEAQRQAYEKNQRAGTDLLKSRLAELQARSSNSATPLARSSSSASAASTMSDSTAPSSVIENNVELQIRNAELASRLLEVEKQAEVSEAAAQREKGQLNGLLDLKQRELDETEARAEDWKQKYLAAQRMLDQLSAAQSAADENRRPSVSPDTDLLPSRTTSLTRRPLSTAQSPAPSARSSLVSPSQNPSSPWSKSIPPPLPYSPHQQRERERERKARRETIARDLQRLKEGKVVGNSRDGWDSPTTSPTKSEFAARREKWSS
ncbi:Kinesin-related protein 4 [Rhodotorula toruloides]|nr:Kinesin-related protein 4 [Rhodotorula toruloides]